MEVPQTYNNMHLVKCYKSFALYENKYYKECFTYHELGNRTAQIIDKDIKVSSHF